MTVSYLREARYLKTVLIATFWAFSETKKGAVRGGEAIAKILYGSTQIGEISDNFFLEIGDIFLHRGDISADGLTVVLKIGHPRFQALDSLLDSFFVVR